MLGSVFMDGKESFSLAGATALRGALVPGMGVEVAGSVSET